MSGMEMMIKQAIKAAGIDPEKLKGDLQTFKETVTGKLSSIEEHFSSIQKQNAEILAALQRVEERQERAWQMYLEKEQEHTLQNRQPTAPLPLSH